jgi:hypothetical protein
MPAAQLLLSYLPHLAQRVNDLFRDKLHITTAQLAEITGRVRELEGEKREVWDRTLQSVSQNAQFQEALSVTGASSLFFTCRLSFHVLVRNASGRTSDKITQCRGTGSSEIGTISKARGQVKHSFYTDTIQRLILHAFRMDQINERNKELNTEVVALRPLQQECAVRLSYSSHR